MNHNNSHLLESIVSLVFHESVIPVAPTGLNKCNGCFKELKTKTGPVIRFSLLSCAFSRYSLKLSRKLCPQPHPKDFTTGINLSISDTNYSF